MADFKPVSLLDAYEGQRDKIQQRRLADLQQQVVQQGLLEKMQADAKRRQYEQAVAELGPNATQEDLVRVASQFGGPESVMKSHQSSLDRQATIGAQRETATAREAMQRELATARAEAAARQAEMLHEFRMSQARTAEDRAAETARHNKAMEDYRRTQTPQEPLVPVKEPDGRVIYAPRSQAAGREVGGRITDVNLGKQVQQLGRDLEKADLPPTIAVLNRAEAITPEIASYITGPMSALPDRAVPKEARDARQDVQRLFNITLKQRSGAAVTNQELDRLKQEFGTGIIKTPDQLISAIGRMREIIENHYTGIAGGYGKDALDAYNANVEAVGGSPFQVRPKASPGAPTQPGAPKPAAGPFSDPDKEKRYQEWKARQRR